MAAGVSGTVSRLIRECGSPACGGAAAGVPRICRSLHSGTGQPGHAGPALGSGGQPAGASADAARESWYITVRSVVWDQAESAGAQQAAAAGPQARISRTAWPAVQAPCEHRREQASLSDEVADRVVLDDLAKLTVQAAGDGEQPAAADAASSLAGRTRLALDAAALVRTAPQLSAQVPDSWPCLGSPGRPPPSGMRTPARRSAAMANP